MPPSFPHRILAATDLSEISAAAVRTALAWARRFDAELLVLSAVEHDLPPRYFTPEQIAGLMRQVRTGEAQARAELEAWVGGLGGPPVPFEAVTGPGPADQAILRGIEVIRPDLLVMGTHGRHGYSRFLMGSTAEKVVRQASIPILVIRGEAPPLPDGKIPRILCAADSPLAPGPSLPMVAALAHRLGAALVAVHSLEVPGWLAAGGVPPERRQEAEEGLRSLLARYAPELQTKPVVAVGPAYRRILEAATTEQAALIVLGGRQPGSPFPVFGSTAIRVMRHAPCPVLAVPAPSDGGADKATGGSF